MADQQQQKQKRPIDVLCETIEKMRPEIKKTLPPHISIDKFVRNAQTHVKTRAEKILPCEPNSILSSIMTAAQFGLMLDGEEAAIVPRGKTAKCSPGYQGYLKLVRNSGEIASITVKVVYEGDVFKRWTDENGEHLRHEEDPEGKQEKITHAYMITKTKTSGTYIEVMTRKDLDKVRAMSPTGKSADGPWATWEEMMSRKSVIRRGYKVLPKSTDVDQLPDHQNIDKLMHTDDDLFIPEPPPEEPPPEQKTSSPRLKDAVNKSMAKDAEPPPAEGNGADKEIPPVSEQPL